MDQYDYDVFISYAHCDETWVTGTLLPKLEAAGLKVCIDFRDFKAGKAAVHNMKDAVRRSQRTVIVLTPGWISREWTQFELLLSMTTDPVGFRQRIIPVLRQECEAPDELTILTYVDFTRADREKIAWGQLLTALGKQPEREHTPEHRPAGWLLDNPYPMPPHFTGRLAERRMLTEWLESDPEHPLLSIRALGGFGKSALVWHWLTHDVTPKSWPRVVWWSFYEADASFEGFLSSSLSHLTQHEIDIARLGGKPALLQLREQLRVPGTLMLLDGFERLLRAFGGMAAAYQGDDASNEPNGRDCISPLATDLLRIIASMPGIRSKVLLTTRLCPRALEAKGGGLVLGCRDHELKQMQPEDAVAFFRARRIRGMPSEICAACAPYGYHPLSLRLLAGLVSRDFEHPGDIAVARRLDVSGDLVQRQHHVLEVAYDTLAARRKSLLGKIACFRSPVAFAVLARLAGRSRSTATSRSSPARDSAAAENRASNPITGSLEDDLEDLIERGLLHHDTSSRRFDLHPIVRRYAYDRLASRARKATHQNMRDYFAAVPRPVVVASVDDLAPVIELYHHMTQAEQFDEAFLLLRDRIHKPVYYQFGAYYLMIDLLHMLLPEGEDAPPRLSSARTRSWTLMSLANCKQMCGMPRQAASLGKRAAALDENDRDDRNLSISLGNVGECLLALGEFKQSQLHLRRAISLARREGITLYESRERERLAVAYSLRGLFDHFMVEARTSLSLLSKTLTPSDRASNRLLVARASLLHSRATPRSDPEIRRAAAEAAQQAMQLLLEAAKDGQSCERDFVRAHLLLAAAQVATNRFEQADSNLSESLERCRRINLIELEGDILIELARLREVTRQPEESQHLAEEALEITERCEYALQGADARLVLARLAINRGATSQAIEHARAAHRLSTCDGGPDYTYKAAFDEAARLLGQLGGAPAG